MNHKRNAYTNGGLAIVRCSSLRLLMATDADADAAADAAAAAGFPALDRSG